MNPRLLTRLVPGPLLSTLLLAGSAAAAAWTAYEHLPGASPVVLIVNDKPRAYFRVTPQAPLTVPVEGPARLRVVTRVELPAGSRQVATYVVRATEGARVLEELSTESSAADQVRPAAGKGALGKSRKLTFDVPAGSHRITLGLSGAASALLRIQQAVPAGGEVPMVSLAPVSASRSVSVLEGEKTIPYYSVLPGQPVRLRVVGPTSLELMARLDFDATMRGTQSYRLRLVENGKLLKEARLNTTKATTASYSNLADRVPSKFDRILFAVPDGVHEITVELAAPARGSAEIHARIPAPTVGNEE